jgi:ATP-binding cassette subfamily C protein LapB
MRRFPASPGQADAPASYALKASAGGPGGAEAAVARSGRTLWNLLGGALRLPPAVVTASLVMNILGLALPLVVLQVFDRVIRYQALNTLMLLMVGFLCVILAEAVLRFARNWLVGAVALQEGFTLHMRGVARLLNAPRADTAPLLPERAADGLAAIDEMAQFLSSHGRLALLDFPFIVLFLGLIWAIAGPIVLVPVGLIVGFTVWTIRSSANFKRLLNEQVRLERERFDFYAETLRGIATVKSLAIEPQIQQRFERLLTESAPVNFMLVLRTNRMITTGQLFASLTIISIITLGGLMAIEGYLTVGSVAACLLIANRVTQPVLRIIGIWGQLEAARLARERYATLMALPPKPAVISESQGPASVDLVDLAMTIPGAIQQPPGIHLSIKHAEVVGIIVPNITQRGQFLRLLQGDLLPDRGAVLIDGVNIAGPDGAARTRAMLFVGSRPDIFHGTILDNISMFRRVSHASALEMAHRLGVEPVIQALPQGYDTRLGDISAAALPADILQAICVVRAAALRPRILLLDIRRIPPDDVSTRACAGAIRELSGTTTVIIVGRQLIEVRDADRIFTLEDWRLDQLSSPASQSPGQGPPKPPFLSAPDIEGGKGDG